jgi:hypothetical protein
MLRRLLRQGNRSRANPAVRDGGWNAPDTVLFPGSVALPSYPYLDRLIGRGKRPSTPDPDPGKVAGPFNADWAWRPALWCTPIDDAGLCPATSGARLGEEVAIFHDCALSETTLRQICGPARADCPPCALHLDVLRFSGSYLSVVVELPPDALAGMKRSHLMRLGVKFASERTVATRVRLNIRQGPDVAQMVREIPQATHGTEVEFDLAYAGLNDRRIEQVWLDLIFAAPEMNAIVLHDITLSRRPRAEI